MATLTNHRMPRQPQACLDHGGAATPRIPARYGFHHLEADRFAVYAVGRKRNFRSCAAHENVIINDFVIIMTPAAAQQVPMSHVVFCPVPMAKRR
jgi:hypothetical protein